MSTLVIAEKPSVGRDLAAVLGARARGDGYLHGGGYVVTWAIGHLAALAEPHEMDPAWKAWRMASLPMVPRAWALVTPASTRAQFEVVKRLLAAREISDVVCATDAGREGELIFRYLYEAAGASKPVRRLWISSLTPAAIAAGFRGLRDGAAFDRLADAARGRSRADWLVGMNLSRAYSLVHDDHLSVGRVQTPTLAMVVARELEIERFVPEAYVEVVARFEAPAGERYEGTYVRGGVPAAQARRLPADGVIAEEVLGRARRGQAAIVEARREAKRHAPPLLYDLAELQRHANRLFGFTAQRTLEIAQALYEKHKLISYPRTDSRHLSQAIAETLPAIARAIEGPYAAMLGRPAGDRPLGPRFVDDARVGDHHAILPTPVAPPAGLPPDERKIHDLICRRLLMAWQEDQVVAITHVSTAIRCDGVEDRYASTGTSVEVVGWKALDLRSRSEATLPGGLVVGLAVVVVDGKVVAKATTPPPRLTDGTLLTAMETAGKALAAGDEVEDREIVEAMRECGLGTAATRAAILETLLRREYVVREGKGLRATAKGIGLIERVHPEVKSPAMTGAWEAKLRRIERGEGSLGAFMGEIEAFVREVIEGVRGGGGPSPSTSPSRPTSTRSPTPTPTSTPTPTPTPTPTSTQRSTSTSSSPPTMATLTPAAGSTLTLSSSPPARRRDVEGLLGETFRLASFRPHQERVCREVIGGRDVLLVMPTGAGKSLCYQLPGLARGGTTLVVSPLIALMEDQVGKLAALGISAARIHSGRDRAASRAACQAYLDGALEFLFIAPERLGVPGFPELLARRRPTLIAIDEAHCISQWGHDFRPDYRMLGQRLPMLRPAPVIALTATATPAVQDDIVRELRLERAGRFIHGFRRSNIAVEVLERPVGARAGEIRGLLAPAARRPAIVYAPTRKEAEALAQAINGAIDGVGRTAGAGGARVGVYHAGLKAEARAAVHEGFIEGAVDVVVATTAFGMGIDKADVRTVVHAALPATIEGYYQELGRAGRDGLPARAVLLHGYADLRTHTFFLERDYPSVEVLARVHGELGDEANTVAEVARRSGLDGDDVEKALEKLWVHGGAVIDVDETVRRGAGEWRAPYAAQRAHKQAQLERMQQYAERAACRMLQLVGHFGDQHDDGAPCGVCDVCAPEGAVAQRFRAADARELSACARIGAALAARDGLTSGQLHRDLLGVGDDAFDRDEVEALLAALARAGVVRIVGETFIKDGKEIGFQRVHRGPTALAAAEVRMVEVVAAPARARGARGVKGGKAGGWRAGGASASASSDGGGRRVGRAGQVALPAELEPLREALRAWRRREGESRKIPYFRILTDRALLGIVAARPRTLPALLAVEGVGEGTISRHGPAILAVVAAPGEGGAVMTVSAPRGSGGDPRASAARDGGTAARPRAKPARARGGKRGGRRPRG